MLRSMTGFGSASSHEGGITLHIEIRSVNNKFYKVNVRSPEALQGLEAEIDAKVSSYIHRGSVSITIKFADTSSDAAASINSDAIQSYIDQIRSIDDSIQIDAGRLLSLPGSWLWGQWFYVKPWFALMSHARDPCVRLRRV